MPPLLTDADYAKAAQELGCNVPAIHAVSDIEAPGGAFLDDGRPVILYESHQFHIATKGKFDSTHPDLSTPSWVHNYGPAGAHQYDRLEAAKALDQIAALSSTSWGKYQVMGSNFAPCGYGNVADFVQAMYASEANHLEVFVRYLQSTGIARDLASHNWVSFALRYNGRGERANQYDTKLAAAYARQVEKYGAGSNG
ncbi:MAG: N-acetylmuramidase family protein [Blastocatellia bacterium]